MDTANMLAVVEKYLPHMNQDSLLQTYLASDVSIPTTTPFAESPPDPALTADAITPPAAAVEEVSTATVSAAPQRLAADPLESPPKADEPLVRSHQVDARYGPVASNERLWDIAAKVRPDPGISKPHMMKALLRANPQAFSKPNNMDSLKVGATLRIPTLREIVETTDSKAARQLLEQQEIATTSSPPTPEPEPVAETPSMLEPLASEPADETPPVSEPTESEPAPDSEMLPAGETSPAH
jgi:FimV-like protein